MAGDSANCYFKAKYFKYSTTP